MGLPSGDYRVWGQEVVVDGDACFLPDRSSFAGSVVPMDSCLRNVLRIVGMPLEEALRMVSTTPASILGLADRKGRLAPGMDADMVILDREIQVTHTIVLGQHVFSEI
jgi:N-acetylglucosamine-6-phosphate deacetylase